MMNQILEYLPFIVAPFILILWSIISAFVFRLGFKGSGIGLDYMIFTIIIALALLRGGVI